MSSKTKILFVDDEETIRVLFRRAMANDSLIIETASDGEEALKKLKTFSAEIVISDVRMPKMDGLALLKKIRVRYPDIFVVIVTGFGAIEDAVSAMKAGAYDYILKPFDFDTIRMLINKITAHTRILEQSIFPGQDHRKNYRLENFIGQDPKMFQVFQRIIDVAKSDATVLVTGETGTGKELVAKAIHFNSPRRSEPYVEVNGAALTETLINSELFGHEKGAFTGALTQKKGHFELADRGTIFLDEIGDVPIPTQISLLRVLELGTFHRVGGTRTLKVDSRVVCATNQDLSNAVKEKLFREDLFYRINVVSLHIPPLRERRSDIPLLADHFLKKHCTKAKKDIPRISRAAMNKLIRYGWPGNVRELTNVIERAVIFCEGSEIVPANLPKILRETFRKEQLTVTLSSSSLPNAEATLIREVLEETDWNLKQASEMLDIARGTLYSKMKKYNIEKPEDRGK